MKVISFDFSKKIARATIATVIAFSVLAMTSSVYAATPDPELIARLTAQLSSLKTQLAGLASTHSNVVTSSGSIKVGDRVQTTTNLNARTTPGTSGTRIGTVPALTAGTVLEGPMSNGGVLQTQVNASTWWKVQYDNGVTGWSYGSYMRNVGSDYGGVPEGTEAVTCNSFTVSPTAVVPGGFTTAQWSTSNADRVVLHAAGMQTPMTFAKDENSYTFAPAKTGSYSLTAYGKNNTQATCVASVTVKATANADAAVPVCDYATFTPSNVKVGDSVTASWKVSNAVKVLVSSNLGDIKNTNDTEGTYTFNAEKGASYSVAAFGGNGNRVMCKAKLVVQEVSTVATTPICNLFTLTPNAVTKGASVKATWDTTNAVTVYMTNTYGDMRKTGLADDGTYSFVPTQTDDYLLTVVGKDGTRNTCMAPVKVNPK